VAYGSHCPSPIFELVAHSSQMAIFVTCIEHGGESVTALAGFIAVLVGRSAGTDGRTDGAAEASSSRPRSDGAKLRDKQGHAQRPMERNILGVGSLASRH
jgi:hypothetical protein